MSEPSTGPDHAEIVARAIRAALTKAERGETTFIPAEVSAEAAITALTEAGALAEFRRLHLEHLARCNQQAHRESLLNIWDMVKKAEAERDLLRVQLHDAHERIALALVACKDLEPYALPGDALQLARKVVGILTRDGGVDGPRAAVDGSVGLERQNGTSEAQASAGGDMVPLGCGDPGCTATDEPVRVERHTSECYQKRRAAEIAGYVADEDWADDEPEGQTDVR